MKRILFATTNDHVPWGGSEELWYRTCRLFLEADFKVAIYRKKWDPEPGVIQQIAHYSNLKIINAAPELSLGSKLFNRLVPSKNGIKAIEGGKKEILNWKPDLVVISQGDNRQGIDLMKDLKDAEIRFVTISQAVSECMWPSFAQQSLMDSGFSNSHMNYFVSHSNLHTTEIQIGRKIENAKIVWNPFNVDYDSNIQYPVSEIYDLACVARYEFNAKGQDVLLEVLNEKKWRERNIRVNFYGSGQHSELLRKLIELFQLKNALVQGYKKTSEIWSCNHALILPSRYEGLPLALVEAMLCGRFGIVTNVSGNPEIVSDNINGFIASAPKPEYLDEAMERAWQRKHEWNVIGEKAKEYIRGRVPQEPARSFYNDLRECI